MTEAELIKLVRQIERVDAKRNELVRLRNQAAAELITTHTTRTLGDACGVSHATIINWAGGHK